MTCKLDVSIPLSQCRQLERIEEVSVTRRGQELFAGGDGISETSATKVRS